MSIRFSKFEIKAQVNEGELPAGKKIYPKGILASDFMRMWNEGYTGKGIIIAVIDGGIDQNHKDFNGRITKRINLTSEDRPSLHGTHVAGIIGANGTVTGGSPDCTFIDIKIMSSDSGSVDNLIKAIGLAVTNGANIINMSLGGSDLTASELERMTEAINNAWQNGVICVSASGNEGKSICTVDKYEYPASVQKSESVASCDVSDDLKTFKLSVYSNENDKVDVAACGQYIFSTSPGDKYSVLSGTSMATPYVSAFASNLLQYIKIKYPTISGSTLSSTLVSAIHKNLINIGGCYSGFNNISFGSGFIQYKPEESIIDPPGIKYFFKGEFIGYQFDKK